MPRTLWYVLAAGVPAVLAYVLAKRYHPWLALGQSDEVNRCLDNTVNAVLAGDWDRTAAATEKLGEVWRRSGYRRSQSKDKRDPSGLAADLSRLEDAGAAKNKADALQALSNLRDYWEGPEH